MIPARTIISEGSISPSRTITSPLRNSRADGGFGQLLLFIVM